MGGTVLRVLLAGTFASLVMMPAGFVFQAMGWRVGHYGPKFARLFVDMPTPPFLFVQHLLIGWVSTLPMLWLLSRPMGRERPVLTGVLYGAGYYVAINGLALPLAFGDPLPVTLGITTVIPSLVVHVVFGAALGVALSRWGRSGR